MTFEAWWKDYMSVFAYSNVTDAEINAARSAAEAAWEFSAFQSFDQGAQAGREEGYYSAKEFYP